MSKVSGTDWLRHQAAQTAPGSAPTVDTVAAVSLQAEQWLQKRGVKYAPPTLIPMDLIDERRSRNNQARRDPIVTDSVERFAAAMKSGEAAFPPIVVYPVSGRLTIVDGNNRQAAARRAGKDEILGIVIDEKTSSELIQLLTVEANAHHGVTPELSWRINQAFHLCDLGFSDTAAAEAAAISLTQLKGARAVREADARAKALKVMGFSNLVPTARGALNVIKDEPVFEAACQAAIDSNMTIDEVRNMIRDTKNLPSEQARLDHIAEIVKEREQEASIRNPGARGRGKGGHLASARQGLAAGIGKILAVDTLQLSRTIITPHDRDDVVKRLTQLQRKLVEIEIAMKNHELGED